MIVSDNTKNKNMSNYKEVYLELMTLSTIYKEIPEVDSVKWLDNTLSIVVEGKVWLLEIKTVYLNGTSEYVICVSLSCDSEHYYKLSSEDVFKEIMVNISSVLKFIPLRKHQVATHLKSYTIAILSDIDRGIRNKIFRYNSWSDAMFWIFDDVLNKELKSTQNMIESLCSGHIQLCITDEGRLYYYGGTGWGNKEGYYKYSWQAPFKRDFRESVEGNFNPTFDEIKSALIVEAQPPIIRKLKNLKLSPENKYILNEVLSDNYEKHPRRN